MNTHRMITRRKATSTSPSLDPVCESFMESVSSTVADDLNGKKETTWFSFKEQFGKHISDPTVLANLQSLPSDAEPFAWDGTYQDAICYAVIQFLNFALQQQWNVRNDPVLSFKESLLRQISIVGDVFRVSQIYFTKETMGEANWYRIKPLVESIQQKTSEIPKSGFELLKAVMTHLTDEEYQLATDTLNLIENYKVQQPHVADAK